MKAVLFDAGGTLIHMDRRFFIQTLNDHGVAADLDAFARADLCGRREISRIMRSGDPGTDTVRWRAYARVLMTELGCEGEALEAVRSALRARHESGDLWTYVEDGTIETLQQLRENNYRIGVVSNADGRVATFLERAGVSRYLDVIVDSALFGVEKPDPRIFLHACERLGVSPSDTPYIGDVYEVDAIGARRAGLRPIMLAQAAEPDWECAVIGSLGELSRVLLGTPAKLAI